MKLSKHNLKVGLNAQHKTQHGFGLIELMVTLAIVGFLAIAMVLIFLSGRASFLTQEQLGRLQENGRYAFYVMTKELQRAGYRPQVWEPPALGFALTANTTDGGSALPDAVELQYETNRDCNGAFNANTVSVAQPDGTLIDVPDSYHKLVSFTVTDNQLVFVCSYGPINGALVQQINSPVATGVENLQIQYGEDLTGNFSVGSWVDAGDWSDFSNVVAVRLALMVRTPEPFTTEPDAETYDLYSLTTDSVNDRRIRRVYSGQVSLRNLTL
jgi:type IV pilus assembly protein PilW